MTLSLSNIIHSEMTHIKSNKTRSISIIPSKRKMSKKRTQSNPNLLKLTKIIRVSIKVSPNDINPKEQKKIKKSTQLSIDHHNIEKTISQQSQTPLVNFRSNPTKNSVDKYLKTNILLSSFTGILILITIPRNYNCYFIKQRKVK
mgnify:FL=1